jgi:hypothetical protein
MIDIKNSTFIMDNSLEGNLIYDETDIAAYLEDLFHDISIEPDAVDSQGSAEYYKINGRLGTYNGDGFDLYVSPIFIR